MIDIEGTESAIPGQRYPVCIAGRRNGTPEDRGGVYGYTEGLLILVKPSHPERAADAEMFGDGFDPEAFSLDAINAALAG